MTKKRIFSGIQPSGNLHIGNYLGAILQWVDMQDDFDCVFCVVDYHAITVKQDPQVLHGRIVDIAKTYLAAGLDPKKVAIFQQSAVSAHTELGWILNTISRMSDLLRMTQFKDKGQIRIDFDKMEEDEYSGGAVELEAKYQLEEKASYSARDVVTYMHSVEMATAQRFVDEMKSINKVGVGLFDYPVLMAADILLYDTEVVPVGEDQKQHVELARDLARRFNHEYENVFVVPMPHVKKEGARIMGLDNPEKKMSKSAASESNYIALTDDPEKAAKKIMKATTDSGSEIVFDKENKPGISNLLNIYALLGGKKIKDLEAQYAGQTYGVFKKDLAEVVKSFLADFQKKYDAISDDEVRKILDDGAARVRPMAEETLARAKKAIGVL